MRGADFQWLSTALKMLERLQEKFKKRARSEILRAKFGAIYHQGLWGRHESRSGAGSVCDSQWVMIAGVAIAQVVNDYGIRSIAVGRSAGPLGDRKTQSPERPAFARR